MRYSAAGVPCSSVSSTPKKNQIFLFRGYPGADARQGINGPIEFAIRRVLVRAYQAARTPSFRFFLFGSLPESHCPVEGL